MRPRKSRPNARLVGVAGFVLAMALSSTSRGQDTWTLARYVPREGVVLHLEYDGLDAHAEAWRKTAACKILNTTTTGVLLEDLFVQLYRNYQGANAPGAEALVAFKHVARSGFVYALVDAPKPGEGHCQVFAFRDAYKNKEVRPTFAKILSGLAAPNTKAQAVVRAGHKVISGKMANGDTYSWWVEESKKEDLVIVLGDPNSADSVLETLDGKRPSISEHPQRVALVKPREGFIPTGLWFAGPGSFRHGKLWEDLGFKDITSYDLRWGFQDDALMTMARVATSGPRKGVLALLDGPTFEKGQLPPIPESVGGFTVASFDLKSTMEKLLALARAFKPDAEAQVNRFLDSMKGTTKLRLKEDVLAHLGPKVAWYVLPSKAATAAPAASSMFGRLLAGAGIEQIPRLAVVFDVDDPVAFGKVLDEAMIAANREFKAQAAKGLGEAAKGSRNRGPNPPSLEFRRKEDPKTYFLSVPPELSGQYPASFRPAIQVGPKHAVLAASIDIAKAVLESKGTWTPANELGVAFQALSPSLKVLNVSDPRETLPAVLASLPAKLQSALNTASLLRQPNGAPAPNGGPPPGQGPGEPGRPREPGNPGANPGPGAAPTLVLQVDSAKLPSADAIKSLLFPSVFAVEVDGEEIKISSRDAFPPFVDPSRLSLSAMISSLRGGGFPPAGGAPPTPGVAPPGSPPAASNEGAPGKGATSRPRSGKPMGGAIP